ncbi:hypothetical protein [Stygiolobus caldivivus]|uniref:Uncharacterized protein n=1 Tax=Stygiolobus caldivivus TaxID=2824673 RepID=A0A8D5U666_9CREN|nr:hypothetical protein [Stygiolobus caldivivus]BCU69727.1 hypothetical protein KN1_10240 [Stygiolobus caldivivus]
MKPISWFMIGICLALLIGVVLSQTFVSSETIYARAYVANIVIRGEGRLMFYNPYPFPLIINSTNVLETVPPFQNVTIVKYSSIIYVTNYYGNFKMIIYVNSIVNTSMT